jgi:DNA repair exonuclease SbcCD ATPase subunit
VPEDEIAFMQDYKKDEQKAELFSKVNAGKVRVLIGSTQTMGAGTNAQKRMAALHHLDVPWRPRDIEQREGRILRPGIINEEVDIRRHLTEGTFDVYGWQTLERKARPIVKVLDRDLSVRKIEDIDAATVTYAEMKAIATGNPALIEKVSVDAELRKLTSLEAAYRQRSFKLRQTTEKLPQEIAETEAQVRRVRASLAAIEQAEARATASEAQAKAEVDQARAWAREAAEKYKADKTPENQDSSDRAKRAAKSKAEHFQQNKGFGMSLRGRAYDRRKQAGSTLAQIESDIMRDPQPGREPEEIGEYLGFPLLVKHPGVIGGEAKFYLKLTDEEAQLITPNRESGRTFDPLNDTGNITRLRRAMTAPARRLAQAEGQLANLQAELESVQGSTGGGFEHQERLDFLKQRVTELAEELAVD